MNRRRFLELMGWAGGAFTVRQARAAEAAEPNLARDNDRPEYHFLAPRSWMNDPNGPIWWKGKYHLFYQWSPYSVTGGPPHWGHAVSTDLVHWKQLPFALEPTPGTADRDGCWTGSAVVRNGVPTVIYTGVIHDDAARGTDHEWRQAQMMATAEDDDLLHWKKLPQPVIPGPPPSMDVTGFRDPCPWREGDMWYVVIGSGERDKGGEVLLYRSSDFETWEYLHPLVHGERTANMAPDSVDRGDMWECPDFFQVDGRHCLFYSSENKVTWATGDYDVQNHRFTIKRTGLVDQGGVAYYAPKGFTTPGGQRILWGWVREMRSRADYAAAGWAGAISLPRLLTIGSQGQLEINPAPELHRLRRAEVRIPLKPGAPYRLPLSTLRYELRIPMDLFKDGAVSVRLLGKDTRLWELTLDLKGNQVTSGETKFALPGLPWPEPTLRTFLDGSIVESFIGGREALTSRVYGLKPGETELEIALTGGRAIDVSVWPLDAISTDRLTT